ncbi:hypothetical protein [Nocardioides pakistanensis]
MAATVKTRLDTRNAIRSTSDAAQRLAEFRARQGLPDSTAGPVYVEARRAWGRVITPHRLREDTGIFVVRDFSRRIPVYYAVRASDAAVYPLGPGDPNRLLDSLRTALEGGRARPVFRI